MVLPLQFSFDKLRNFVYDTLNPNISESIDPRVPISLTNTMGQKLLSCIELDIENNKNVIWLGATIGFRVSGPSGGSPPPARILYRIWRGLPNEGILVYSTTDSGQGGDGEGEPTSRTTNINQIDLLKKSCGKITYCLTAEAFDIVENVDIDVIGPITFIAAEIDV